MHISSKKRFKSRQHIRCKIQSLLNKNKPRFCFHNEYAIKRGNFLLQNKLKKTKSKHELRELCERHKHEFRREMDKHSLQRLMHQIFASLKRREIEDVLDDPIFFFRDHSSLLTYIQKRVRRLEKKYLKPTPQIRRVNSDSLQQSVKGLLGSRGFSTKRLFHMSPEIK